MQMLMYTEFIFCQQPKSLETFFRIGKGTLLKKILSSQSFFVNAQIFDLPVNLVSKEEIIHAGENILLELFNTKKALH